MLLAENVALSTADFDLLWELATRGQIMDRDALLKNLRGVTYDGMDRSVDVAISRLRKNCSTTPRSPIVLRPFATKATCSPLTHGITKRPFCGPARPAHCALGRQSYHVCCLLRSSRRAHSSPELVILTKSIELAVQNPIT